ncbi:DUF3558 domain-containing protein [Streptomyces sp. TS71-3]|uniref:DUF3558 domain-containing protein n=1 Tax=Streptomyces sp. TS71-3 TaxID=2733862 RepID=UPI001B144BA6|nr:DUF3558 domain-containing protein [Streptomyces sp. TS71-3]GHJ34792.1 hypothetical protein Sm713_04010 [Streptomyces sp. TS71-3]
MHRPAQRLTRILACAAAVPVILVASGCTSGSGDGGSEPGDGSSSAASKDSGSDGAAGAQPAYSALPGACKTLSDKTLEKLVPEADPSGTMAKSADTSVRSSCSWSSLDNNGVKGSQFRWLNVSLVRFTSDQSRDGATTQASQYYAKQVAGAKATEGATGVSSQPVSGTGDAATAVNYGLKKDEGSFKQQTVVTRIQNVVVTVDYNGAGLAGEKAPDTSGLLQDTQSAAKEAIAAVVAANGSSASGSSSSGSSDSSS